MAYLNYLLFMAVGEIDLVKDHLEDVSFRWFVHLELDFMTT